MVIATSLNRNRNYKYTDNEGLVSYDISNTQRVPFLSVWEKTTTQHADVNGSTSTFLLRKPKKKLGMRRSKNGLCNEMIDIILIVCCP